MRVVGEAATGLEAFQNAAVLEPDVLLMDLHMPSMDGIAATRRIRARLADIKVLVVTVFDQPEDVRAAVSAGAAGFVVKNGPLQDLLAAIRWVHAGHHILSPEATDGVFALLRASDQDPAIREIEVGLDEPVSITGREADVLQLIAMGKNNAEISGELFLAPSSVKTYVSRLRGKLRARTRAELVTLYYVNSRIAADADLAQSQMPVFSTRGSPLHTPPRAGTRAGARPERRTRPRPGRAAGDGF